ncbi:ribokinase-like isoform X2 [Liolophura sinensis]|uniref:ribokinase-like isoform X2 n=1 Tax=Liolophura sinensis TaxID=3198878 RepID=UPI00315958D7
MMDVVVVGSCNVDLISYVPRLPKPGETIHGSRFSIGFGGKGANQCVSSGRLGARTAMVAKIGTDSFGDDYLKNLQDSGVNTDFVYRTSEASTGVAPISVTDEGQNAIVIVPGANLLLTESDVIAAETLIQSAKVLVCQLEISPPITVMAMRLARKHGVRTILNPAPALSDLPEEMFTLSDILCPNETEAEILSGMSVKSVDDAKKASLLLLDRGCKAVIITLGEQGAVVAFQGETTPIHIPAKKVKSIDSTGAGDAFLGGLAFYLSTLPGLEFIEAVRRAGEIATISVQAEGTQKSYPYRANLEPHMFAV